MKLYQKKVFVSEQTRWDISMVKEIEVVTNIPEELQVACLPYIRQCKLETKFSGLGDGKLSCNEHFDSSACAGIFLCVQSVKIHTF